jgi:hypothetical protein
MKQFFKTIFPGNCVKTIAALILLAAAIVALLGMQIHRSIIRSRTVTQATMRKDGRRWGSTGRASDQAEGKLLEGGTKIYGVDTPSWSEPRSGKLNASSTRRSAYRTAGAWFTGLGHERADTIAELYRVPVEAIRLSTT